MSENRRRRNNGAQNTQVKKARTNNARRILLLVGLMSLVAVISIGGTIAWLTAESGKVENTFTTADININLEETKTPDGEELKAGEKWDAKLVPGNTYDKDPTVPVAAGSEACWLFVHVDAQNNTITNADGTTVIIDKIVEFNIAEGWTAVTDHDGYYYREVSAVAADATEVPTFSVLKDDTVKISEALTKEQEKTLKDAGTEPKIVITAAAVQKDNVSIDDAWAKLPTNFTNPTTTTTTTP